MPFDPEPTPEFNEKCSHILDQWERGDLSFRDASAQLDMLRTEAAETNHPANQGRAELLLGVMQGYRANLDASITHFERARSLFEQAGNRKRAVSAILNLGESYRWKGNFARARQLFRAAFDAAETLGETDTQAIASFNEGQILLSMEQPESARRSIENALALAGRIARDDQREELTCEIKTALAKVYLLLGDNPKAWTFACDALNEARTIGQPLQLGVAHRVLGEMISELNESAVAQADISSDPDDHFRASTEAFQEIKAEGEVAKTMYAHALSLAKRGKGMTGARKMQQAMIIFTRLGMNDDAAKAARAQIDVLARATTSMEPVRDAPRRLPSVDSTGDQPAVSSSSKF